MTELIGIVNHQRRVKLNSLFHQCFVVTEVAIHHGGGVHRVTDKCNPSMAKGEQVVCQDISAVDVITNDRIDGVLVLGEVDKNCRQAGRKNDVYVTRSKLTKDDDAVDFVFEDQAGRFTAFFILRLDHFKDRIIAVIQQLLTKLLLDLHRGVTTLRVSFTDEDANVMGCSIAHILCDEIFLIPHLSGNGDNLFPYFVAYSLFTSKGFTDSDGAYPHSLGDVSHCDWLLHTLG